MPVGRHTALHDVLHDLEIILERCDVHSLDDDVREMVREELNCVSIIDRLIRVTTIILLRANLRRSL